MTIATSVNEKGYTKLYASTFVGRHGDTIGSLLDDGRICFFTGDTTGTVTPGRVYEVELVGLAGQGKQYAVVKAIKEDYPPIKREFKADGIPANPYAPKQATPCAYMPPTPKPAHLPNFYATLRASGSMHVQIPAIVDHVYAPYHKKRLMIRLQPIDAPNVALPTFSARVSRAGTGYCFHVPLTIRHAYADYADKKVLVTATPGA